MLEDLNQKTYNRKNMFYWQTDRPFTEKEIKKNFLDRHKNFNQRRFIKAIEYGMIQTGENKNQAKVEKILDPIPFGSVNIVCRVILANGTKLVIRAHPPGIKNGYFWVESLASQKAKDAGVPSYSTYFINDTWKKINFDYQLIEFLPGKTMQKLHPLNKNLEKKLIEETGYYLAKIHSVKTSKYGFFDNRIAKEKGRLVGINNSWRGHIFAAFKNNLDYLTKTETISLSERKKIEKIFSKNENLIKCDEPRLIHNDIADWNQLVEKEKVTGIVDWDECYSGDPVADFSAWTVFFPFERMKHLKRGYKKFSPLPDDFEEKLHLYRTRYIVSKMTLRTKKLIFKKDNFTQSLLDFSLKILKEELKWYDLSEN